MKTLFEIMQNSETLSRYINDERALIESIQWHLSKLLNTRRGSISHLPDYGISDISQIYLTMPKSVHSFVEEIIAVVEKYETRLQNIKVTNIYFHEEKAVIRFDISGQTILKQAICLNTNFNSFGQAVVIVQEDKG